jgi:putative pyruvate formate lyase activating enzyme
VTATPARYVTSAREGRLARLATRLVRRLDECDLCPRGCAVDRRRELGSCGTPAEATVASWGPHHGEERPISAHRGSGTVFLSGCNLACAFCQNADISTTPACVSGRRMSADELADVYLELQDLRCHNLNWVSPTHQIAALVDALERAERRGLRLPIVYNSGGYDDADVIRALGDVVDVWMPDLKYADNAVGAELSGVPDYVDRARASLTEMFRQVGDRWELGPDGELERGMLVRILVLPGTLAGVESSLRWIADTLSPELPVSLLAQYRPLLRRPVDRFPELRRRLERDEWRSAVDALDRWMGGNRQMVQVRFI